MGVYLLAASYPVAKGMAKVAVFLLTVVSCITMAEFFGETKKGPDISAAAHLQNNIIKRQAEASKKFKKTEKQKKKNLKLKLKGCKNGKKNCKKSKRQRNNKKKLKNNWSKKKVGKSKKRKN